LSCSRQALDRTLMSYRKELINELHDRTQSGLIDHRKLVAWETFEGATFVATTFHKQ